MTITNIRRLAAAAALAAAAIAAPVLMSLGNAAQDGASISATGQCLAWLGSRGDGQCIAYSNGSPTYIGTPNMGVWGPGYGAGGIYTGPLMPGTTINQGITP